MLIALHVAPRARDKVCEPALTCNPVHVLRNSRLAHSARTWGVTSAGFAAISVYALPDRMNLVRQDAVQVQRTTKPRVCGDFLADLLLAALQPASLGLRALSRFAAALLAREHNVIAAGLVRPAGPGDVHAGAPVHKTQTQPRGHMRGTVLLACPCRLEVWKAQSC
jgi:hypothetical protein